MDHTGKEYQGLRGKYKIKNHLGGGGMGVIYEAIDSNGKIVIVKFSAIKNPNSTDMYDEGRRDIARRKLKDEAEFLKELAGINAQNIVKYIDESKNPNNFFFVMEKISGETLLERMRSSSTGLTDLNILVRYSLDLLRALEYSHNQNIIYRDLKPENIMVEEKTDRLILLDFGGATKKNTQITSVDEGGTLVGGGRWMCPHQNMSQSSKQCDLYSFGKIFSFLASGQIPPKGGLPKKLHILKPRLSPDFTTLADNMLDDTHKKIHSASQLATAIRSLPTSSPKPPKRIGKTGSLQAQPTQNQNVRIVLNGTEHKIPLDQAGMIIGKYHDARMCKTNNAGCNSTHGDNVFIGWNCPATCNCDTNPAHKIDKHHMKIMKSTDGKFYLINNDQYRRSAIYRQGKWSPTAYNSPTQLQHNDKVALLYNEQKGPYEPFMFYMR